eukprot:TRINITY_DN6802_c0_g1_i2.p1 TRINITY_DN6802_c0_g1~~TRINITY_DN6802_c0_g1_i2.p1  ORF type:complete len:470 (-),score=100.27 TRINITY_DN6802_c0_g1_i2:1069-2478(-)
MKRKPVHVSGEDAADSETDLAQSNTTVGELNRPSKRLKTGRENAGDDCIMDEDDAPPDLVHELVELLAACSGVLTSSPLYSCNDTLVRLVSLVTDLMNNGFKDLSVKAFEALQNFVKVRGLDGTSVIDSGLLHLIAEILISEEKSAMCNFADVVMCLTSILQFFTVWTGVLNAQIVSSVFLFWKRMDPAERMETTLVSKLASFVSKLVKGHSFSLSQRQDRINRLLKETPIMEMMMDLISVDKFSEEEYFHSLTECFISFDECDPRLFRESLRPEQIKELHDFAAFAGETSTREQFADVILRLQNYNPSAKEEVALDYYMNNLFGVIPAEMTSDLCKLMASFATDGYRIGQILDVRDHLRKWCAAEVLDVEDSKIKIHYTGWKPKFDEWIAVPSHRVCPAFLQTMAFPGPGLSERELGDPNIDNWLREPALNLRTRDEASQAFRQYGFEFQKTINGLRYANRARLLDRV